MKTLVRVVGVGRGGGSGKGMKTLVRVVGLGGGVGKG